MTNLKEQLKKIYDFVNAEFDIESEEAFNKVKEGLELEKLDTLNKMVKDYKKALKKAVNAEKRKQKQKEAQKNFKNVQTNLKMKDYTEIENFAMSENMTISELLKNALLSYISPKKPEAIQISSENDLKVLKGKYNALKIEKERLIEQKTADIEKIAKLEKEKTTYFENMTSLKKENETLEKEKNKYKNLNDLKDEDIITLKTKNKKLENALEQTKQDILKLQDMSIFDFIKMKLKR